MSDVDWSLSPEGAVELRQDSSLGILRWFNKDGKIWFEQQWMLTDVEFKTIATRPQPKIIGVGDMKAGMMVRCVEAKSGWYEVGEVYTVGTDWQGRFGPLGEGNNISPYLGKYKFTLVEDVTRKTVEDAVEFYNSVFPEGAAILGIAFSNDKILPYHIGSPLANGTNSPDSYIICTREEFEACVAAKNAKSEPKWTHILNGKRFKIIINESDIDGNIVALCERGDYFLVHHESLKPIKPTMTKAEAEEKLGVTIEG